MFVTRFLFGLTLFLMLALMVIVAIAVASSGVMNNDNDSDSRSGGGYSGSYGGGMNAWTPNFWYVDFGSWFGWGNDRPATDRKRDSLPIAIFSFVFGDGNPNANLEDRRWQAIANVIYNAKGAVVAEQVMPYLDIPGSGFDRDYEQFMIPVLSRFNGSPEVTDEGQFLYRFPDLQKTLGEVNAESQPDYLEEYRWKLSNADSTLVMWAALLGIILFSMSLFFTGVLPKSIAAPSGILRSITIASTAYSSFYLGLPLVRWVLMWGKNDKIAARNQARSTHARELQTPTPALTQKLTQAQALASQIRVDQQEMIYTTDRDLLEQEIEQRDRLDAEWQRRLEGQ